MSQDWEKTSAERIAAIWTPPGNWKLSGTWFWWFWLFFIHDRHTLKTGKCRQIMILWSIKKDDEIKCNSLDIRIPLQIEKLKNGWKLNGAAAAWYFDGQEMHEDIVLEKSGMHLDFEKSKLIAPGKTPSEFYLDGDEFVTRIKTDEISFELRARKTDPHPDVGPNYGRSRYPMGMEIEATRIEVLKLTGTETVSDGTRQPITGTAYFQKVLVAAPPPQWYWGVYHFADGSYFSYMLPYFGKAMLADNLWKGAGLSMPMLPINPDIMLYHAPSGRFFLGHEMSVKPTRISGTDLWKHSIRGGSGEFQVETEAEAYAHGCWKFVKNIGMLPVKSTFKYNEYPATVKKLVLTLKSGEKITLENGWGNMENSWGFII